MSNKIDFELNDKKYSLHFGMDAYEIVAENSYNDTVDKSVSSFKMCAYIIWGGLVNDCVLKRKPKNQYPTFEFAYILAEEIFQQSEEFQKSIFDIWTDSVANKELLRVLEETKKKAEKELDQIGMKLELMHTEN